MRGHFEILGNPQDYGLNIQFQLTGCKKTVYLFAKTPGISDRCRHEKKSAGKLITEILCFRMLTEEQNLIVQNASHIVSYDAGEGLFKQDTPVSHFMYVQSGLIKIFKESVSKAITRTRC